MKIFLRTIGYAATIGAAVLIFNSETVQEILARIAPITFVGEFVAGMLYTSLITIPISVALLGTLAQSSNIFLIAILGGAGAVLGDFLLMNFFQRLSRTLHIREHKRPKLHPKVPKWLVRTLGVVCLMSPVPDEIAMALLGITKIHIRTFVLIVYPAKALGILLIAFGAGSLLS